MRYVIKSCFRLSSIAAVHLRKSWTSLAPMTPRIKPGSHRELIFQEVHNQCRKNSISGCGMLAENHMPGLLSAKHISVCHTLSNICHTDFIASCKRQFSHLSVNIFLQRSFHLCYNTSQGNVRSCMRDLRRVLCWLRRESRLFRNILTYKSSLFLFRQLN